jgi:eukaryotic-like serine/threonine-protein kinase
MARSRLRSKSSLAETPSIAAPPASQRAKVVSWRGARAKTLATSQREPLPISAGDVVDGKYRIEGVIGSGSMGVVVAAVQLALGRKVAIKFLLPQAAERADAAIRFLREARAAAKIDSDHVAQVIDVGRLAESGLPYIVMEYLEGPNLAELLRREGPLAVETALEYVLQACDALAHAHAAGVVHRDLKPENLVLARRSGGSVRVKVVDFGISKILEGDVPYAVKTHVDFMGSPVFMSPEQMLTPADVDARSDVWALGVTLYHLLTGHFPFPGENIAQVCASVLQGAPRPVRQLRPDVPAALERIILRCLAKDCGERFADARELFEALSGLAAGKKRQPAGVRPVRALRACPARTADLEKTRKTLPPRGATS